ncbi:DUF4412 domain-containing protein [Desulfococcaceae bacterium HSG8]|nr:DUF4412 domain-containing protein [Desulfococcaceae bacterium HSG8]
METKGMPKGLEALPEHIRDKAADQFKPRTDTVKNYLTAYASRTDTTDGTMIMNFDAMTIYHLNPGNKTYTKFDVMSQGEDGGMGQAFIQGMTKDVQISSTDETKEISGYKCKKYIMKLMGEESEYWLSKDVEGYDEFREMTEKMKKMFEKSPMLGQTNMVGIISKLDGFPIMIVMNMMGMKTVTTLKKVEKKSLSKDLFKVPEGYKLQK